MTLKRLIIQRQPIPRQFSDLVGCYGWRVLEREYQKLSDGQQPLGDICLQAGVYEERQHAIASDRRERDVKVCVRDLLPHVRHGDVGRRPSAPAEGHSLLREGLRCECDGVVIEDPLRALRIDDFEGRHAKKQAVASGPPLWRVQERGACLCGSAPQYG